MADKTYKLSLSLSNGSTIDAGNFVVPQGDSGVYVGTTQPDNPSENPIWINPTEDVPTDGLPPIREEWTFELEDGSTVTKRVALYD